MATLLLSESQVRELTDMAAVVEAVEDAFGAHGRGEVEMPPKVYIDLPEVPGDFRAMPAFMDGGAGVKWVNSHPMNPARHSLPAVMGMYILSNPETAEPIAVLDATWLTAIRTGAAGAVASRFLGVAAPRTIGFVGCGVQSRVLLAAHRVLYPELEVRGADIDDAAARAFAEEAGGKATSLEQACACDIVCTTTPVRTPVVERSWIASGTHINAMGADGPGKQELDPAILKDARVVIDDLEQASHSGEINVPMHDGLMTAESIHGTIGEVVAGKCAGREGDEISVFDSTGLAIQDVAVARRIVALARSRGIGTEFDFRA